MYDKYTEGVTGFTNVGTINDNLLRSMMILCPWRDIARVTVDLLQ